MFPGGFGGIPDRLFPQTVPPTIPPDRPPFRKLIPIVYLEGTNKYPNQGQPESWEGGPRKGGVGEAVNFVAPRTVCGALVKMADDFLRRLLRGWTHRECSERRVF